MCQILLSKSISDHKAPRVSPDLAAVKIKNSIVSLVMMPAFDCLTVSRHSGTCLLKRRDRIFLPWFFF